MLHVSDALALRWVRAPRLVAAAALLAVAAGVRADATALAPAAREASEARVEGRVVDDEGRGLPFADVFLEGQEPVAYHDAVVSEENGWFCFRSVPHGTYALYAFVPGWISERVSRVVPEPDAVAPCEIRLHPLELAEEVVGVAPRTTASPSGERSDVQSIPLANRRVERVIRPGRVARRAPLPRVAVGRGASDEIGDRPNVVAALDPMPIEAVEAFRLIPTGFSAKYGPRSSGMAEIAGAGPAPADREGYRALEESGFRSSILSPLSTFSVDVDTASYSNVRRLLRSATLPPPGSVRVEELLNYFEHDDPAPAGDVPFAVSSEVVRCPWRPANRLVRVALKGREDQERRSRNLVFLVDVSGSMQPREKLPLVKEALRLLAGTLEPGDMVGLVVYAGAAGVVLEPTGDVARVVAAVDRLAAGGLTAGGAGVETAYGLAREHFVEAGVNRVVLCTDGDFNVGVSSEAGLVELVEKERESGVFLTVLGFGTGNLQDARMEALADHGNGQYGYVDCIEEAERLLVRRVAGTLVPIAADVKLQVEMNPSRVAQWRLIGYENRRLTAEDFDDDRKDAGEIGAGHSVIALYEVAPAPEVPAGEGSASDAAAFPRRYVRPAELTEAAASDELMTVSLRWKEPGEPTSRQTMHRVVDGDSELEAASEDMRFDAAVAGFGQILGGSRYVADLGWGEVVRLAEDGLGADPHGERAAFVALARTARRLAQAAPPAR